jgi:L-lactate dehydrogenase complex protein LldF
MSSSLAQQFATDSALKSTDLRHRAIIQKAITNYSTKVADTKSTYINWQYGRELARTIKWNAINHLDKYLEEFEKVASSHGAIVHWAEDSEDVHQILLEICQKHQVKNVVKSKSMVTEEIHLNEFLEKNEIRVLETDLGEYIVQLRGETPYHIVTPVMHLTKEDIDQTFHEKLGTSLGSTAEELAGTAREVLRNEYIRADLGITGANFIIANTGMVSITENEGNARLCSALPKIHVAITGIEKVVPRFEDLSLFLPMLAVSGTGQQLTCYNTMIGGPRQSDECDGPEEFHVILLDNGRTKLLEDPEQREALHCIRCGACLNVCPIYRNIGGHAYGTTYQGPIGSVITPHLKGLKEWNHLSYASSLCGACTETCPVHIELHEHLLQNRRNAVRSGFRGILEQFLFFFWALFMSNSTAYSIAGKLSRIFQKMAHATGIEGHVIDPLHQWSKTRALPPIAEVSFREWWEQRNSSKK